MRTVKSTFGMQFRQRSSSRILARLALIAVSSFVLAPSVLVADAPEQAMLAKSLVKHGGVDRGVCAVLGIDGDLPIEIARTSNLLVHVRDPRGDAVTDLRTRADQAGFDINRLAVLQGSLDRLGYADNMIDVVVASQFTESARGQLTAAEMLRVLRPLGIAVLGIARSAESDGAAAEFEKLIAWARSANSDGLESWSDETGHWVRFAKPALAGTGDWSHWEHGPDNNPVSSDTIIKAPYMTQFLAEPLYIPIPSITTAAAGRTFLAIGHIAHHRREWNLFNTLIARNGYNGAVLWQRKLPEGYLVHRSAFIATAETFYMIDGDHVLMLDPQAGAEQGEIRIPGLDGQWKWMAMKNGVLYVLAGKKDPATQIMKGDRSFGGWSWDDLDKGYYRQPRINWGFGTSVAAWDLKAQTLLWKHDEDTPIDSRVMSLGEDRVSVYCPEKHMRCLDLKSGKVLWTNDDRSVLDLIEEHGRNLTSTPGFRTACMCVFTPEALIIQGQTQMNVVAVSPADGYLLWTKKKVTNNPNAIYIDGKVILGVGERGTHVVVDPATGNELENLGFTKTACTRLTACSDSFFVRGEGMLRYDRNVKKVLIDGAARPACNDGAMAANGLLYVGPWQCDCNLSLIGCLARCSAGDFRFDHVATEADHLETANNSDQVAEFSVAAKDWPTYRGNNSRSGSTPVAIASEVETAWEYAPERAWVPNPPVSASGMVFTTAWDGKIRAIDAGSGKLQWQVATAAEINAPPSVAEGRVYVGCTDGYVYCLEAKTGRQLWRFRAAPVERNIMVYGAMSSTWPVNTGVLVDNGVAYFAAGIIDYDGTYVYALDAQTGKIKWQNNSCGHLNRELRKGVSAQGNLAIQGKQLILAGGNQVSPARFDLETGSCIAPDIEQGQPKANNGRFAGVLDDQRVLVGGRILYSAPDNVSTKGSYSLVGTDKGFKLAFGGIPPAWSDATVAAVNYQYGKVTACDTSRVRQQFENGIPAREQRRYGDTLVEALAAGRGVRWESNWGDSEKFEPLALAVAPNAVLAVVTYQNKDRAQQQWYVVAFKTEDGAPIWKQEIRGEPLPDSLTIDSSGRVAVALLDGRIVCFKPRG